MQKKDGHQDSRPAPSMTVLPHGWKGAANYWAQVVAKVYKGFEKDEALVYQDDVMVHSTKFGRHYKTIEKVYKCLRERVIIKFTLVKTHLNMPSATFTTTYSAYCQHEYIEIVEDPKCKKSICKQFPNLVRFEKKNHFTFFFFFFFFFFFLCFFFFTSLKVSTRLPALQCQLCYCQKYHTNINF